MIKSALDTIADEMAYTVMRTARSPIVRDVLDYSATLCDAEGQIIAQAKTVALHLGAVPDAMAEVLARFGDDLAPGDVVILNDPYAGGMHLPDVFMFKPIFEDATLLGFAVVIAHQCDMGGRVPGSNASDSTEIFQEGLRIPPLKLYRRGVPQRDPVRHHRAQCAAAQAGAGRHRGPARRMPDRRAGAATAGRRYGTETVRTYVRELIDYAERLTRSAIAAWPKGTFRFEDHIDDDGFDDTPDPDPGRDHGARRQPPGRLRRQLAAGQGRHQQHHVVHQVRDLSLGPLRAGPRCAQQCRRLSLHRGEGTQGIDPQPARARPRSRHARLPATGWSTPCSARSPRSCPSACRPPAKAATRWSASAATTSSRAPFVVVDMINGAWGGRPDKDGIEGVTNPSQNMSNTPVEVLEARSPVLVEDLRLPPDSCGAGRSAAGSAWCGNTGCWPDEAVLQLRADRHRFAPFGLAGGQPARCSRNMLNPASEARELPAKVTMTIHAGDVIRHEQPGGGGHGDPAHRDPAAIARDLADGKISPDHKRRFYGGSDRGTCPGSQRSFDAPARGLRILAHGDRPPGSRRS